MYKYCAVKFNRGTGLGNKLFPWARCVVYAKKNKCRILKVNWIQLRKASFIAGGIDYKVSLGKILLAGNFIPSNAQLSVIESFFVKIFKTSKVKIFQGDGNFFDDLRAERDFIKTSLISITNRRTLNKISKYKNFPIVLNIRRGKDFKDPQSELDFLNEGGIRTPLSWFKNTLTDIRMFSGKDYPALVVSDGTEDDLKELLMLSNITLAKTDKAIADLLLLSQAKVLLGSGGSSFSAWGSFLSKAITLTIPGQNLQWFKISNETNDHLVDVYDPREQKKEILEKIKVVLDKI